MEKSIYSRWFCHFIARPDKNYRDFIELSESLGYEFVDMKDYVVATRSDNGYRHRKHRMELAELIQEYADFNKIPHYDLIFHSFEFYRISKDGVDLYGI